MVTLPRTLPRTPGRVRPALLAPAVVAIVLGILGMHGIDAHGVTMHGAVAHAEAAPSTATSMGMPVHDPDSVEGGGAHSTPHPETSAAGHNSGDAGGMGGMGMLCVAMLAGAAAALLAFLVRRGSRPKVWAVLKPARRGWHPAPPHVWRIGTGPPSVWRFSVIRC